MAVSYPGAVFDLISAFNEKAQHLNWDVSGLLTPEGSVYSLGSDSKLIGRIFELISTGAVKEIAEEHGYVLEASPQQTVYPDFTLIDPNNPNEKIAIDVKSTYRRFTAKGAVSAFGFTLGAFGSFLRNGTKNIAYPYSEYAKHFVIGFVYTRNSEIDEGAAYSLDERLRIAVPYHDVEYFIQEKHKLSGDRPGSGNTENIGTFKSSSVQDFRDGLGPFASLGQEAFELYWRNYPRYRSVDRLYTNLNGFLDWCSNQGITIEHGEISRPRPGA